MTHCQSLSNPLFQELESLTGIGAWELDPTGNRMICSPGLYDILDITPDQFNHTLDGFLEFIPAQERSRIQHTIQESLRCGSRLEMNHGINRAGQKIAIQTRHILTYHATEDQSLRCMGIIRPLPKTASCHLENGEVKGEGCGFLTNLNHEIRTPMNAVLGMLDFALMSPETEQVHDFLKTAKESAVLLLQLLNNLLDISKIETGQIHFKEEPLNLRSLLHSMKQLYSYSAEAKKIAFTCLWDDNLPEWIKGDEEKLRQILTNLIGNAFQYTDQGSITLRARLLQDERKIFLTSDKPVIQFCIADTGIGIPPERMEMIFQTLRPTEFSLIRNYGGSSLGLSLSKKLAELMGGDISVQSSPREGSEFSLQIPLKVMAQGQQTETTSIGYQKQNVLLVEDSVISQKLAELILKRMGHQITTVENGQKALSRLQQTPYDLILMDIEMPEMDGIETTRRIRAGEGGHHNQATPIIAMSAHVIKDVQKQARLAGMNGYITKPFDITRLQKKINSILGQKHEASAD